MIRGGRRVVSRFGDLKAVVPLTTRLRTSALHNTLLFMSRSKHQTYKKVFGDKSAAEIDAMFAEGDEDALKLLEKRRVKRKVRQKRQQGKIAD